RDWSSDVCSSDLGLHINILHVTLIFSFWADQVGNRYRRIAQIIFCQQVHAVPSVGIDEVMCQHRIKKLALHLNTIPCQQQQIKLSVLPYLLDTFVFKHRLDRKSTRLNSSHVKISYAV